MPHNGAPQFADYKCKPTKCRPKCADGKCKQNVVIERANFVQVRILKHYIKIINR